MRFKLAFICLLIKFNVGLTSDCNDFNIDNVHCQLKPLIEILLKEPDFEKHYNAIYNFWNIEGNEGITLPELPTEHFDNKSPLYILRFYYNFVVNKDLTGSKLIFNTLKQAAENGLSEAQYQLSKFYNKIKEDKTDVNKQKRRHEEEKYWLEKAKENGNEKANVEWSRQYLDELEREYTHNKHVYDLDFKELIKHLHTICNAEYSDRNDMTKFIWLAKLYSLGIGTFPDWIKAHQLINKVKYLFGIKTTTLDMEERFPKSHHHCLELYIDKNAYQKINTLYDWLTYFNISANNNNNPLAQYLLGQIYLGFVQYIKEDVSEATKYFKRAHNNNFILASVRLGIIYTNKAISTKDSVAIYNSFNQSLEYFLAAKSNTSNNDESNKIQRYIDDVSTNMNQLKEQIPELKKNSQRSEQLTKLNNKRIKRKEDRSNAKNTAHTQVEEVKSVEQIKQQDEELLRLFSTEKSNAKPKINKRANNSDKKPIQNNNQKIKENTTIQQIVSVNSTNIDDILPLSVRQYSESESGWNQQKSKNARKREAEQRRKQKVEKLEQEQALAQKKFARLEQKKALQQKQAQTPADNQMSKQEFNLVEQATQQTLLKPKSTTRQTAHCQQRTALQERNPNVVGKIENVSDVMPHDSSLTPIFGPTMRNIDLRAQQQDQHDDSLVIIGSKKKPQPSEQYVSNNLVSSVIEETVEQKNLREKFNLDFNGQEVVRLQNQLREIALQMESESDSSKRKLLRKILNEIQTKIADITILIIKQNSFLLENNINLRQLHFEELQKKFPEFK